MPLRGTPLSPGRASGRVVVRIDLPPTPPQGSGIAVVPRLPESREVDFRAWQGLVVDTPPPEGGVPVGLPPSVAGLAPELFVDGETVRIDGGSGVVEVEGVRVSEVVTAFLERADGRILLLRRSASVGSFQGRWSGVSGYLEDPTPREQAIREVREETGISSDHLRFVAEGTVVRVREGARIFIVHPLRFRVEFPEVRVDWESEGFEWVLPSELPRRRTVPKLVEAWASVEPRAVPAASEKR